MRIRIALLCIVATAAFSQTPPQHKRLLYSDSLTNAASTKLGTIINRGGRFLAGRGWEVVDQNSQLQINLPAPLPGEGTFVINATNFNPATQNVDAKQNILSLCSAEKMYESPDYDTGSWWLYRTGTGYSSGAGMAGFRIDYACKGVDSRSDGRAMESATWNKNKVYEFKVIWTANWIGFYVDGTLIMDPSISGTAWSGQNQFFRYLFVGRDSKGYPAMPGPVWSNVRIYVPGPPLTISKDSGDGQSAYTGNTLANPLVVKISDDTGVGQPNIPVTFTLTQGAGQIIETQPVLTDANGLASVHLKLGAQAGAYSIQARSDGATGSPLTFTATATLPSIRVRKISGDDQTGAAGKALATDVVVKAIYQNGNPVANEPLVFRILSGNGSFNGLSTVTVNTDLTGLAAARWTLGTAVGMQTIVVSHGDSTVQFTATAGPSSNQKLLLINGGDQSGSPGQPLPQPIVVQVRDEFENPVSGQTVTFTVIAGMGRLQGAAEKVLLTDGSGNASVIWTLGPYRGMAQNLQITASSNSSPLQGSPLLVQADGGPAPDAAQSQITASTPVIANGSDKSSITVTLRNQSGQALSGYAVKISVSGSMNTLSVSDTLTNAAGQVTATLASLKAESKTVSARVPGSEIWLANTATVQFDPVPQVASRIVTISSSNQQGVVNTILTEPLTVQVFDAKNQPVVNYPVDYSILSGDGSFAGQPQLTVMTDQQGIARAYLTLGTSVGVVRAAVRSAPASSIVEFTATAGAAPASQLMLTGGGGQAGEPGKTLAAPITVTVKDLYENPVPGQTVKFAVLSGGGTIEGAQEKSNVSDKDGRASVYWTLGRYRGVSNRLEVSSWRDDTPLQGSPIVLEQAEYDLPSAEKCRIRATTPVMADGQAYSDILVTVVDQDYSPLSGFTVDIKVSGGDNLLALPDSLSDRNGEVQALLSSRKAETKTVSARIKGMNLDLNAQATVVFTAPPPEVVTLEYVSGNDQTGQVRTLLAQPLVVRAINENLQPKGGIHVEFAIVAGGGLLGGRTQTAVLSDPDGYCRIPWTLGPLTGHGNNVVSVKILNSADAPLLFTASADAGSPVQWNIASGDSQIVTAGQTLPLPLCIQMHDGEGNAVANFPVSFNLQQGNGGFPSTKQLAVRTDGTGKARAPFTAGTQAIVHLVRTSIPSSALQSLLFTIFVNPDSPARLLKISGDSLNTLFDKGTQYNFVAKVTDRFDNPVPGQIIRFTALDGGRIASSSNLSDLAGLVNCQVNAGTHSGIYHYEARLNESISAVFTLNTSLPPSPQPPIIYSYSPADTIARVNLGQSLQFQFNSIVNPDGEPVVFRWLFNGITVSTQTSLHLVVNSTMSSQFVITGLVCDDEDTSFVRWHLQVNPMSVATSEENQLPDRILLEANYPNPFNAVTTLRFALPERQMARLQIYNLSGQIVSTLIDDQLSAGIHTCQWSGMSDSGESLPSGVYYGVLQSGATRLTRKVVLLR